MLVTCGEFPADLPESQESLTISMSGRTHNARVRSRNIGLSANYLADYISSFEHPESIDKTGPARRSELWDTISFIANELLENALKFHFNPERELSLRLQLGSASAAFILINTVDPASVTTLTTRFSDLLSKDPAELYVEHVERSAAAGKSTASGLGLLTMLNDYGARLAWRIESLPGETIVTLTTLVQLAI